MSCPKCKEPMRAIVSIASKLKNMETKRSNGFCGSCNRNTDALWERTGDRLTVSCEGCGKILVKGYYLIPRLEEL